jgi:hypothetical protein
MEMQDGAIDADLLIATGERDNAAQAGPSVRQIADRTTLEHFANHDCGAVTSSDGGDAAWFGCAFLSASD